jgi:hypothetical protein
MISWLLIILFLFWSFIFNNLKIWNFFIFILFTFWCDLFHDYSTLYDIQIFLINLFFAVVQEMRNIFRLWQSLYLWSLSQYNIISYILISASLMFCPYRMNKIILFISACDLTRSVILQHPDLHLPLNKISINRVNWCL